jgi:methionyl-tRNA formyltransferase
MTYAPMLKKEDGRLDFESPAAELERRVRAMNPWPGAWFEWEGNVLKVSRAVIGEGKGSKRGRRLIVDGRPAISCLDGVLILEEVQPPGKKIMPGKAFLSGARNWENA